MTMLTLSLARSLALLAFAAGCLYAQKPAFDVASIKPGVPLTGGALAALREDINTSAGTLTMRNTKLSTIIRWAYKLNVYELAGPDWIDNTRFDIIAKPEVTATEDQLRVMLQSLLADRFQLVMHRGPKSVSGYALVTIAGVEPKLQKAEGGGEGRMVGNGILLLEGQKMPLSRLTDILSSALKEPVQDATGLQGFYDFKVDLRSYVTPPAPGQQLDIAGIAIPALKDQLGLKLESRKITLDVLTVDSAEKTPTGN